MAAGGVGGDDADVNSATAPTPPPARVRAVRALPLFVGGCLLVGATAGLATVEGVRTWYPTVVKPSWTPPDAVFGPVWTVLYVAMGFAAWRVWARGPSPRVARALTLFGVQLGLNAAWSPIFFALHRPDVALAVIVALDVALAGTILAFRRVDRAAAIVLVPYLLWCLFATALNAAIA